VLDFDGNMLFKSTEANTDRFRDR